MLCRGASPRRTPLHPHSRGPQAPPRAPGSLAVARSRVSGSFRGAGRAGERAAGRLRAAAGDVGVDERDYVAFVEAGDDGAALGDVGHLDVAAIEAVADLDEHVVLAGLLEDRLPRDVDGVLDVAPVDDDAHRRSRAHLRIELIERQDDVELAGGARVAHVATR